MKKIKIMVAFMVLKGRSCNTIGYKCKFLGYGLDRSMCWFFEKKLKKILTIDEYIYKKCQECKDKTDMAIREEVKHD